MRGEGSTAIVVGAGVIGLCCANALSRRGWRVTIVSEQRPGEASPAAGGILGPCVEAGSSAALDFGVAARDRYPGFLDELEERTGVKVPLLRNGILEVAINEEDALKLRRAMPHGSEWLTQNDLRYTEPALERATGAVRHPEDGAVDNLLLLAALRRALHDDSSVRFVDARVTDLVTRAGIPTAGVRSSGGLYEGDVVVLATGAWTLGIEGLPRPLPVTPLRGQMLSVAARPLSHVTYGPHGYIVPRGSLSVLGTTMEPVGFDAVTTESGIALITRAAQSLCPALRGAREVARWSGLRPITPDLMPVIGRDPEHPSVIYAVGHSRNGILLAPLTGDSVAGLASGDSGLDYLVQFSIQRFENGTDAIKAIANH